MASRPESRPRLLSRRVWLVLEIAFLVLVAAGAAVAGLPLAGILAVVAVAGLLVAFVERASRRKAAPAEPREVSPQSAPEPPAPEPMAEAEPEPEAEPKPEPQFAISERSARAILASGQPPLPESPLPEHAVPEPEAEPEPEPVAAQPAEPVESELRAWNVWDLERSLRLRADDPRQEECAALLLHLRDFAQPDGSLPPEFDGLVLDSFGPLLLDAAEPVPAK